MNIQTAYASGKLTICLAGELDHHAARETMRSVMELVDEYMPRECVLDLNGLRFMDSSGVGLMVRLTRRIKELNGRLWIENPGSQVRRVLECAGVDRLVQVTAIGGRT